MNNTIKCHNCKQPYADPPLWFPEPTVHEVSQQLVIMTRMFCCGAIQHTEPVAAVSAYLRPVKENARLTCNLMNQYLLAGRPQPQWLTEAWAKWEEMFSALQKRQQRA